MGSVGQMWKIFEAQHATIIDLLTMLQEDLKQTGSDDRTKGLEDMVITKATTEATAAAHQVRNSRLQGCRTSVEEALNKEGVSMVGRPPQTLDRLQATCGRTVAQSSA
ncbi:unnamed protein product [Dibothriocephalus latus]|uniref:Uncharacterized protein n=1 Tax=Dibothriocephalus latus TaxID=60516 RepID=A0A3P7P2B3_DIBLA|nr:unnamed protein product [Dibothriocephalus latus]